MGGWFAGLCLEQRRANQTPIVGRMIMRIAMAVAAPFMRLILTIK